MIDQIEPNVVFGEEFENGPPPSLPKWPAMVVSGDRVTEQQAAEIVIKTDHHLPDFTYGGNDKQFCAELNRLFNMPDERPLWNDNQDFNISGLITGVEDLRHRLGVIDLEFISNSHIVTSFIGGPSGWCDWNGNIFCNSFNIGKWPEVVEVANEWARVAYAFPFLNLSCQLFDGEQCQDNTQPVVQFNVNNGEVWVCQPSTQLAPPVDTLTTDVMGLFSGTKRERGITIELLKEKLHDVYGDQIPQLDWKIVYDN